MESVDNGISAVIYPVPATNMLFVNYNGAALKSDYTVEVYNNMGQKMENIGLMKNEYSSAINTKDFPNGLYLIRIIEGGKSVFKNTFEVIK